MTPEQKSELLALKQKAFDGMVGFMRDASEAGYTQKHVDKCSAIINVYLGALEKMRGAGSDAAILKHARKAVLSLNKLNDACEGSLLETDQREQLCKLMLVAAKYSGFTGDHDFTEEWREW